VIPDDRLTYAYPPTTIDESDPKVAERRAVREKAYAEALARGLTEKRARIERARADADWVRAEVGLPIEAEVPLVAHTKKRRNR
jgi:hypothetical protein